jgi:hypothetical protein
VTPRKRLSRAGALKFFASRDPRSSVHGVPWDLAAADVPALDRYEAVARGLYEKTFQPAPREPCGYARALVHVGRDAREGVAQIGAARPGYLENIIASAGQWSLPPAYVASLESLLNSKGPSP